MFEINQVCELLKYHLLGVEPPRQIYQAENPFYPQDLTVVQDEPQHYYFDCCDRLIFQNVLPQQKEFALYLHWQLRQVYRIVNAAIASMDHSLEQRKQALICFRSEIEKVPEFAAWLKDIEQGVVETNLLCSGHGHCDIDDSFVKYFYQSEVVVYTPLGASLDNALAGVIEAEKFNPQSVYIQDLKRNKAFRPTAYPFPQQFNQSTLTKLPNFTLSSDKNLKARIIETKTGRILLEIDDKIYLQELLQKFPGRKLLWVACASIYMRNSLQMLSPNGKHGVFFATSKLKKSLPNESSLRRLRKSTVKMKFDARFSLFADDQIGTLNPEIVAECKRKKLPLNNA